MSHIERKPNRQLLHLVFGGELTSLDGVEFRDLHAVDIVGIYPNYAEARKAWQAAAQRHGGVHPDVKPVTNRLLKRMRFAARPALQGAGMAIG